MTTAAFPPSIELARLYEKTSARGTRYMVGRLGLARITLLPGDTADDGTPTWRVLLQESTKSTVTPAGRKVIDCPATYRDDITCDDCQLCQRQKRKVIVGFPGHGAAKRKATAIAKAVQS